MTDITNPKSSVKQPPLPSKNPHKNPAESYEKQMLNSLFYVEWVITGFPSCAKYQTVEEPSGVMQASCFFIYILYCIPA